MKRSVAELNWSGSVWTGINAPLGCRYIQFNSLKCDMAVMLDPRRNALTTWLQVVNRVLLCSVPLFTFGWSTRRNHLQVRTYVYSNIWKEQKGHDWSLAITWYAMAPLGEPCEGPRHFIENGCIHAWRNWLTLLAKHHCSGSNSNVL